MKKLILAPILTIGISLGLNAGSLETYMKACDLGDTGACNNLGIMYVKGKEVKQDYLKAKEIFEKSCNSGDAEGCKKYEITKSLIGHNISSTLPVKTNQPILASPATTAPKSKINVTSSSSKLYQEYRFGMPKAEIIKIDNVYDCADVFEKGALCIDQEKFVGEDVSIAFRFINDKLVTVVLMSEFTQENHLQFVAALSSKFQLMTIESDSEKLDILVQVRKYKKSEFRKNIVDFEERALEKGNIKYTFYEKDSFNKMVKRSDNAVDLLVKADINMRVVQYIIAEIDNQNFVNLIQFITPQEINRILQEKSKQQYGEF